MSSLRSCSWQFISEKPDYSLVIHTLKQAANATKSGSVSVKNINYKSVWWESKLTAWISALLPGE